MITSTMEVSNIDGNNRKPKIKINLVDEVDEINDKVKRGEQDIWSLLLSL